MVRPPAPGAQAARRIEVRTAATPDGCDKAGVTVSVIASGAHRTSTHAAVVFVPDEGRLELEGSGLRGLPVTWRRAPRPTPTAKPLTSGARGVGAPGDLRGSGRRRGRAPPALRDPARDRPALGHPPGLAAPGTPYADDLKVYDARGALVPEDQRTLRPARVLISQVLLPGATVDVSQGPARVAAAPPAVGRLGRLRGGPLRGRRGRHRGAHRVRAGHAAAGAHPAVPRFFLIKPGAAARTTWR
jgi:hypothetical protein